MMCTVSCGDDSHSYSSSELIIQDATCCHNFKGCFGYMRIVIIHDHIYNIIVIRSSFDSSSYYYYHHYVTVQQKPAKIRERLCKRPDRKAKVRSVKHTHTHINMLAAGTFSKRTALSMCSFNLEERVASCSYFS